MTAWRWLTFNEDADENTCKPHAVHVDILHPLVCDLRKRGFGVRRCNQLPTMHMDQGGACIVSAPSVRIEDLGFRFETWCDELSSFKIRLERMPERSFAGGLRYYKMHGAFSAIVLTPEQRTILLAAMEREEPMANKRHDEFMALWRRGHAMRAAKEKADGQAK
jgi:hypothetical protein